MSALLTQLNFPPVLGVAWHGKRDRIRALQETRRQRRGVSYAYAHAAERDRERERLLRARLVRWPDPPVLEPESWPLGHGAC